ncbi:hypothetical protein FRB91_002733 [Serendipita sp. 411]|nr:hypothetical protein FRB91_002733 [Serendipita sp. 411]
MGEDVELPERPISGRQRRRREKMEKRMAEIWGDEESPNQEYPSNLFEVAPVPKPAEVFQSSEISDKISNYVLQPTAEPVVTCEVNLLNEMIQWLEKDEDIVASQEPRIDFVRGSILGKTTVGGGTSVDLCKQVVGPKGIKPILDAVAKNSHIDRFLLGNNIVGDEGAKVIADFIRDEKSKRVYNFYIAGNSISPVGIGEIANALCTNTTVTALWLKRNPLLTEGAKHLANMLSINTTLQTLDLVNTGILDAGIISLMQSLKQNPASGLRHLYLGSNAESAASGHAIGSYLRSGFSRLTSLFCSSSRLGDEGIVAIAEGLKGDQYMERLGFESARCGDVGAKALADALEHHPRIVFLDLGFRKGTYEMGEQPNRITDEGLMYLGDKLIGRSLEERAAKENTLKWLDVVQNAITKQGAADFVRAFVVGNTQLLQVRLQQKGLERNLEVEKTTKRLARENKEQYFVDNGLSDAEYTERARVREALEPQHISEIYSVYRGNM